jgi:pyruvate ferredoxin oxidoreductase delta subunit
MARPLVIKWKKPRHIKDYPAVPVYPAGHLTEENSGWSTQKPVIDMDICQGCLRCYLLCPDGAIYQDNQMIKIDYRFCKGCGICAYECKFKAITFQKVES